MYLQKGGLGEDQQHQPSPRGMYSLGIMCMQKLGRGERRGSCHANYAVLLVLVYRFHVLRYGSEPETCANPFGPPLYSAFNLADAVFVSGPDFPNVLFSMAQATFR